MATLVMAWALHTAPGSSARSVDHGFSHNGRIYVPLGDRFPIAYDHAGNLYAAGESTSLSGGLEIRRYLGSGRIDPTYGDGGAAELPRGGFVDSLTVLPGGGSITTIIGSARNVTLVEKLLPSGEPDPSFGSGGTASIGDLDARSTAVGPDGTVVVGGVGPYQEVNGSTFQSAAMVKLNQQGAPDTSFGNGDGRVEPEGGAVLALGADDVHGVYASVCFGDRSRLVRFTPGGQVDPSFGGERGVVLQSPCPGEIAADAKGGLFYLGLGIRRLDDSGHADPRFNGRSTSNARAFALSNGKVYLLVPATLWQAVSPTMGIEALRANGKLDRSFGRDGLDAVGFGGRGATPGSMAIGPNGRIAMAGFNPFSYGLSAPLAVIRR